MDAIGVLDALRQDLKFSLRILWRNRSFTFITILSLALGIGANTTIFSWIKAVLLQPLPKVAEPARLTLLYSRNQRGERLTSSYPDYLEYCRQSQSLDGMIAYDLIPVSVSSNNRSERSWGAIVSNNYFSVLGVRPAIGNFFAGESPQNNSAAENRAVAVVSYGFWQRRLGGSSDAIGKEVRLNGQNFTVIGVAPAGFLGTFVGVPLDIWVSLANEAAVMPGHNMLNSRGARWLEVMARLKPGVSPAAAESELNTIAARLSESYPAENRGIGVSLYRIIDAPSGLQHSLYPALIVLMAVVGLLLLAACVNAANLLLSRALARRKEIGIRLAMGAGRGRIIQQLLTESMLLSIMAGALALLFTLWTAELLPILLPPLGLPIEFDLSIDRWLLGFTFIISLITGLSFGLLPALQTSRPDLLSSLKDLPEYSPGLGGPRRATWRTILLIAQVAISLVLLVGAGLLLKSLGNTLAVDPGFNPDNVLLLSVSPGLQGYDANRGKAFYQELAERVGALPGVTAVSYARRLPLAAFSGKVLDIFVDTNNEDAQPISIDYNIVGPGYFKTLEIPLRAGREFTTEDREGSIAVAVINEAMAARLWPNQDAIGKRFHLGVSDGPELEVIGVANNGKYYEISESLRPYCYLPVRQYYQPDLMLQVRVKDQPLALVGSVQQTVKDLDKDMPIYDVKTLAAHLKISRFFPRLLAIFLTIFGALAMLLTAIGIYGAISQAVAQRTREIGIRMALGATRLDLIKLIVKQGLMVAISGSVAGLLAAIILTRLLNGLLYRVSTHDPLIFFAAMLFLIIVTLIASYIPARRATRVDPIIALRYE